MIDKPQREMKNKKNGIIEKLLKARKGFEFSEAFESLSNEDLNFITGGTLAVAGAGSSSTSGSNCCVSTCVCKCTAALAISDGEFNIASLVDAAGVEAISSDDAN